VIPGQPSMPTQRAFLLFVSRVANLHTERERDETDRDTRRNEAKEPPAVGKAGFAAGKAGGGTRPGLGTPR